MGRRQWTGGDVFGSSRDALIDFFMSSDFLVNTPYFCVRRPFRQPTPAMVETCARLGASVLEGDAGVAPTKIYRRQRRLGCAFGARFVPLQKVTVVKGNNLRKSAVTMGTNGPKRQDVHSQVSAATSPGDFIMNTGSNLVDDANFTDDRRSFLVTQGNARCHETPTKRWARPCNGPIRVEGDACVAQGCKRPPDWRLPIRDG